MYPNYAPTLTRNPGPERAHPLTSAAISRLMTAAVINKRFRNLLLTRPQEALEAGFQGEDFTLDRAERNLVLTIQAGDLADFALQLSTPRVEKHQVPSGFWIPVDRQAVVLNAE